MSLAHNLYLSLVDSWMVENQNTTLYGKNFNIKETAWRGRA